jgi:hypothetical protein
MSGAHTQEFADTPIDNPNPTPGIVAPDLPPDAPADEPARPTPHSSRDEIAARFSANRAAADAGNPLPDPRDLTPAFIHRDSPDDPTIDDEPVQRSAEVPARTEPAAPAGDQKYKMKVRGNEFELSRAEVLKTANLSEEDAAGIPMPALLRAAQINAAADDYLAEARTTHKDARTAARAPDGTPPSQPAATPDLEQDPESQRTPLSDVELAERIQFGDREEALAAHTELTRRAMAKERTAQFQEQSQTATQRAVNEFAQANPDMFDEAADPLRSQFLFDIAGHLIREDLIKAGVPRDELKQYAKDPAVAAQLLSEAIKRGLPVRQPSEILTAAAQDLRQRMNLPAPTATSPAYTGQPTRQDMKRALTPQPNAANIPPAAVAQQQDPRSNGTSVIMQMRKSRGQAV